MLVVFIESVKLFELALDLLGFSISSPNLLDVLLWASILSCLVEISKRSQPAAKLLQSSYHAHSEAHSTMGLKVGAPKPILLH